MNKLLAGAILVAVLAWAGAASAQIETQITDLNAEALDAYQNLDIDSASAKLLEAIAVAEDNAYVGPEVASSYMNLGVVYAAGLGDLDQGLAAFLNALCMQPDAQLDPLLSTPDVQQVYLQAQADAQAGACPGGASAGTQGGYGGDPGYGVAPQYAQAPASSGPQVADTECPPGIKCGEDGGGESEPGDFARFFLNVQFVAGFALVQSGMEADSAPPRSEVIIDDFARDTDGQPIQQTDAMGNPVVDGAGNPVFEQRIFFDDRSAWVPDADSFDDFENAGLGIGRGLTPVSSKCVADGTATGPTNLLDLTTNEPKFATDVPSKYCVRVESPGIVSNVALRINPGYFLTDTFALSMPFRLQFDSGEGSFSNMLLGLRGELLFSKMTEATGFPVSWFFGFTYGQIQAKPPPKDPSRESPYAVSGPVGGHTGFNFRWRLHRNFGLILGPEIDVQFPDFMINIDLGIGLEAAF